MIIGVLKLLLGASLPSPKHDLARSFLAREDHLDQIKKILAVVGTPSEDTIAVRPAT